MKDYEPSKIRNVGVIAHSGAGKTSLLETFLYNTGAVKRIGRVEDGTTTSDYHPEEIKRGITIYTSLVPIETNGYKVNILDTPGYSDFIGEVTGAMRVADGALSIVSAVDGVEVMTEVTWDEADRHTLPRAVFINKMDRDNADFHRVLTELENKFTATFVPLQLPLGSADSFSGVVDLITKTAYQYQNGKRTEIDLPVDLEEEVEGFRDRIMEAAAEASDDYLVKYLDEGEDLSNAEVVEGLKQRFYQGEIVPVFTGSVSQNIALDLLLENIIEFFPPPVVQADGPLQAFVFKTLTDPYVGRISYLKVYSGSLHSDSQVFNTNKLQSEKVSNIYFFRGKEQENAVIVPAGDLCVLAKLQSTATGDTLCTKEHQVILEEIGFPEPAYSMAIVPKSKGDEEKLSNALNRITEEESTIRVRKDKESRQTVVTGMGETQLQIIVERFQRKFGLDVELAPVELPYRETIRTNVKVEGKYKKQSGGRGQYGHVWLRLEPLNDGQEFIFDEEVFGGAVPGNFFPAVEKGIREAMDQGVLAGYPVTGVKAVLYDGSYHPVDSSEMAFKVAASMAFKKGMEQAYPVLLEPIMNIEVITPESCLGDIISDLNGRRGRILGMDPEGKKTKIQAQVPLAEITRYAVDLKAKTQGRATFTMQFSHYEETPPPLAEKVINSRKSNA